MIHTVTGLHYHGALLLHRMLAFISFQTYISSTISSSLDVQSYFNSQALKTEV